MDKSTAIYEYLLQNCIGYENRVKSDVLMPMFGIKNNKTFRSYIEDARKDKECKYFLASEAGSAGGYWIATNEEEREVACNNLDLRAEKMKETSKIMQEKLLYETV